MFGRILPFTAADQNDTCVNVDDRQSPVVECSAAGRLNPLELAELDIKRVTENANYIDR
jgi:hypothetical protein